MVSGLFSHPMARSRNILVGGTALWWLLVVLPALASGAANSMESGRILVGSRPEAWRIEGALAKQAHADIVPTDRADFARAWQIELREQPAAEYQVQLAATVPDKLERGQTVAMSVWVRTLASSDAGHTGRIGLLLEQSAEPFDKTFSRQFEVGADWQQFDVAARVDRDYAPGSAQVCLRLGYFPQTLEIGGMELRQFDASVAPSDLPQTPMTYRGRSTDAEWRQEADRRIDSLRKARLNVRVTDAMGKPISGAKIRIHMLRQAFAFGCVYNDTRFGPEANSSDDETYRKHFEEFFNTGVDEVGMKWPSWENPAMRPGTLRALQWMHDHGIDVRGHCLVWPGWRHLPEDLRKLAGNPTALENRIDEHLRDEVGALKGQVIEWDVVNEPYLNNDLMHILGDGRLADWYKLTAKMDPSPRLYLNETDVPNALPRDHRYDALYDRVRALQQEGAPIGGIGMQAHFGDLLTAPVDLLTIYDRFAKLGIPIRITELDINVADEQLQADYFRDFLTTSFSDPEINGILLWGFWASQHWRPEAALFRTDWSLKPNGRVWKDLVLGKWWTNANGTSAADGTYSTRGFWGDYELIVTAGQHSRTVKISLPQQGYAVDVAIK
jgi:endo-1,4-beta-xylanase